MGRGAHQVGEAKVRDLDDVIHLAVQQVAGLEVAVDDGGHSLVQEGQPGGGLGGPPQALGGCRVFDAVAAGGQQHFVEVDVAQLCAEQDAGFSRHHSPHLHQIGAADLAKNGQLVPDPLRLLCVVGGQHFDRHWFF